MSTLGPMTPATGPTYTPEGFGKNVTGGAGYTVYTVTTGSGTGNGSLEYGLVTYGENVYIQFDPAVTTCTISAGVHYLGSNITIDGLANGSSGVIIDCTAKGDKRSLVWEEGTSNILLRGLNFRGNGYPNDLAVNINDLVCLDGGSGTSWVDGVLIDRCTFFRSSDGTVDIVGRVKNVTIQWCLFYDCSHTQLIKYELKENLSLHHNVYVHNGERNPQIRGDGTMGVIDYVNNVVYQNVSNVSFDLDYYIQYYPEGDETDPYGLLIWNSNDAEEGVGNVVINVRGCAFIGDVGTLEVATDSGASNASNYWDGSGTGADNNYFNPAGNNPGSSPKVSPNSIASGYEITRMAITSMKAGMVPYVGCPRRTGDDETRINAVVAVLP